MPFLFSRRRIIFFKISLYCRRVLILREPYPRRLHQPVAEVHDVREIGLVANIVDEEYPAVWNRKDQLFVAFAVIHSPRMKEIVAKLLHQFGLRQ